MEKKFFKLSIFVPFLSFQNRCSFPQQLLFQNKLMPSFFFAQIFAKAINVSLLEQIVIGRFGIFSLRARSIPLIPVNLLHPF